MCPTSCRFERQPAQVLLWCGNSKGFSALPVMLPEIFRETPWHLLLGSRDRLPARLEVDSSPGQNSYRRGLRHKSRRGPPGPDLHRRDHGLGGLTAARSFNRDTDYARPRHAKRAGGAHGYVDDAPADEGAAVIDATLNGTAPMRNGDDAAERFGSMRACHFTSMTTAAVIGGKAGLGLRGGDCKQES